MNRDQKVSNFFEAAGDLLAQGLKNLQEDDPGGFRKVNLAIQGGAKLRLETTVDRIGIGRTACFLMFSDDDELELFGIEAETPKAN